MLCLDINCELFAVEVGTAVLTSIAVYFCHPFIQLVTTNKSGY